MEGYILKSFSFKAYNSDIKERTEILRNIDVLVHKNIAVYINNFVCMLVIIRFLAS